MSNNTNEVIVKTENLNKKFGGLMAVDYLNVEINRGQIFGFLRPFGPYTNIPSGLHATIVLMIYGTVSLGMNIYLFRRQDLTA